MSDIFNEVDEEVRRDQFKRLWERHGHLFLILAVLIVAGVGGWRGYQYWQGKAAAAAGSQFEAAMVLSDEGKRDAAEAAFAKLSSDGPAGYQTLSRFRVAAEVAQRDPKAGIKQFDAIAADTGVSQTLRDLAALRSGFLLVDTGSYGELKQRLESLTDGSRTFRHSAREMLALSAWRAGNGNEARHWIDMIMTDPETPAAARSHMDMLLAVTATDNKG